MYIDDQEVIVLRGHHLTQLYNWFIGGHQWTRERIEARVAPVYGRERADREIEFLERLSREPKLKVKLVSREVDYFCDDLNGIPCTLRDKRCFDPIRHDTDGTVISDYGFKVNYIYIAEELITGIKIRFGNRKEVK